MGKSFKIDKLPKLPKRSFIYMLICGGGILLFCLIGIYPNSKAISSLENEISKLNLKNREQEILFPVFKNMLLRIRKTEKKHTPVLKKEKLRKEEIVKLAAVFEKAAITSGMKIEENIIDISELKENAGLLLVILSMKGEFSNFRDFMIRIRSIPYIEKIGTLEIRSGIKEKDFKIGLWLSLE